jgi:hypothetical protein
MADGAERSGVRGVYAPTPDCPAACAVRAIACAPQYEWSCDGWVIPVIFGAGNPSCPNGESGGDPNAQGSEVINGVTYYFNGWWQVEGGSFDPAENTRQAYAQWLQWQRGERPRPWPNCP